VMDELLSDNSSALRNCGQGETYQFGIGRDRGIGGGDDVSISCHRRRRPYR
jgi:hypothetical protein